MPLARKVSPATGAASVAEAVYRHSGVGGPDYPGKAARADEWGKALGVLLAYVAIPEAVADEQFLSGELVTGGIRWVEGEPATAELVIEKVIVSSEPAAASERKAYTALDSAKERGCPPTATASQ